MAIIYGNAISIGYATSGSSVGGIYSIWLTLPAVATSTTFTAVKDGVSTESKYINSIKAAKITLPADNPEGDWTITGTVGGKTVSKTVTIKSGAVDYFVDFRNDFIPLVGDLAVGNLVTFDNKEWRVVHQEGTHWYLAAKDIYSITSFSTGGLAYKNSTLANVASTYESEQLSTIAKEYCLDVTVEDVTAKVFVPTYNQCNGGFEYYNSNTNRICNYNSSARAWWMSDRYGTSGGIRYVYATGETTGSSTPTLGNGFRPHICININNSGLNFTYTGDYRIRFEDGVIELLNSGEFKSLDDNNIDIFCVGGGAGGGNRSGTSGSSGGGGGYTATRLNNKITANTRIDVTIGNGGANGSTGSNGGTTSFGDILSANGGKGGRTNTTTADGGSAGGEGGTYTGGKGGSDGASTSAGSGQGTTTREFGEPTGKLYAAGGGGGCNSTNIADYDVNGGAGSGGKGGGGNGGNYKYPAGAGMANTGSGGGGGQGTNSASHPNGGSGGSGIVCIRKSKPQSTDIPLIGDLAIGNTVTFDDKSFLVVHNTGTKWYLASSTIIENCTSTVLTTKCTEYLSNFSSTAQNYMVAQTIDSYTGKVFLPSRAQLNSGFAYYKNNANRICRYNGEASYWWALTSSSSGYNDSVDSDGAISSNHYSVTLGFRPHICIDTSLSGETIILAGTWMFNDPLSAPESLINEYINFTGKEMVTSTPRNFTGARISTTQFDATPTGALPIVVYKFAEKTWVNKYKYLTFPTDATASDEFITWLKANATKQS